MSRVDTLDGQYGTIPDDAYLRKIERTNLSEDPMQVENYMRGMLADYRPDTPFLASDEARDPSDRGGGTHSTERLALRYSGGRSEEDPYLPDGTFLDHEFLERDPRGVQNQPDWNEARRQKMARAAFVKFSNDESYSVPESGINPVQMRDLIRNSQQQFKDRYTNFEESMDSWHNGGTMQAERGSVIQNITKDGQILDLTESSVRNRQDAVTQLSNNVGGIPRYTTPDHRVKIARYGNVRPMQSIGAQNWNNNRSNAYLDHQIPVEINGQMVNRMLAALIIDIEGQRVNKQSVAQGAQYGDSAVNQTHQARRHINPEDILKITMIGLTSATQPKSSHAHYDGAMMTRAHANISDGDVRYVQNQSVVNIDMAKSMTQVNRPMTANARKDMRESIAKSAARTGVFHEARNMRAVKPTRVTDTMREGLDTRYIEDSKIVKNYSSVTPMKHRTTHENTDHENFGAHSLSTNTRAKNYRKKTATVNTHEYDIDMMEFRDADIRHTGPAEYMARTRTEDAMDFGKSTGSIDMHVVLENMILE
jgi:hypothetical protein